MKISKEQYCIATKSFPLKFMQDGEYYDSINDVVLLDREYCENELNTYDEPELFQILKVQVTYEF